MKEARFFYVPDAATSTELPFDEAMHALRVLRLKAGDDIFLMDGQGRYYEAEVTVGATKRCMYRIKNVVVKEKDWNGYIHLVIAPTKMSDRMEWLVEKATEVGFDELTFLNCKFSERKTMRVARLEKIMIAAMKQSRKPWKPVINSMVNFKDFVKRDEPGKKYIAHCYDDIERVDLFERLSKQEQGCRTTIMIGPEGDFSMDEVKMAMEHGYEPITLGRSRLRTETAGLSAVMMAQLVMRKP